MMLGYMTKQPEVLQEVTESVLGFFYSKLALVRPCAFKELEEQHFAL